MKRILFAICWMFIIADSITGCSRYVVTQQRESHAGPVTDYVSLLGNLRAAGASVKQEGEVDQPFFSVKGKLIKVDSEDVQVFEYATAAAADAEAVLVSRDGSAVGRTKPYWVGPPHFFKREKLLVLYIGDSKQVLKALEALLGPQFAGK